MPKKFNNCLPAFSVKQLARLLGCPYEGDGEVKIRGVASLEKARQGDLVFLSHPKHRTLLEKSEASAAIILKDETYRNIPVILSDNPHLSFIKAVELFYSPYRPEPGIHPTAVISSSAQIGKDVSIGAFCSVGDEVKVGARTVLFPMVIIYPRVKIGEDSVIHSHVSIREETQIGNRVIIHNGTVLGSDGFGYLRREDGSHIKIPQKGIVIIEDDVEIGANVAIDRAALGETIIRKGTKIDNLVQVAHNVEIGENSVLAGQAGIAGSTKIGRSVTMGGQAGVADHVTIGDNVIIGAQTGIAKSIPADSFVIGSPHMDARDFKRLWVELANLSQTIKDFKRLKAKVDELEKILKDAEQKK